VNKLLAVLSTFILIGYAQAEPEQIEVIGLVPNVSTIAEVGGGSTFWIGGYKLTCSAEYIEDLLAQLHCPTGEAIDREGHSASNFEVHDVLVKGFTEKYGEPTNVEGAVIQTRGGGYFTRNTASWTDKKGNKLFVVSSDTRIDKGLLVLQSYTKISADEKEKERVNKARNF